jgi:hypothetical protein
MSINKSSDDNVQDHTEAHYEELASQEEIYLEEREERARAVLISENPSPSGCRESLEVKRWKTDTNNNPRTAANLDGQLNHAAEELITGDSDDSPLGEGAIAEMLRTS